MPVFPFNDLHPMGATLSGTPGNAALDVPLEPFRLEELEISTRIRLDGITLPTLDLASLAGKVFTFPTNPQDGYIDGSVYIEHAHHPVDVTEMIFGTLGDAGLPARVRATFVFSYEGLRAYEDAAGVLSLVVTASTPIA